MPTHNPTIPPPPQPTRVFFDPFNSSSTGHQRAENRLSGSTSWRDSRRHKLSHQFGDPSGRGGDAYISDLVGAGSVDFGRDGRKENGDWEKGAPGLRESGWQDIRHLMVARMNRRGRSDGSKCESESEIEGEVRLKRARRDSGLHGDDDDDDEIPRESVPENDHTPTAMEVEVEKYSEKARDQVSTIEKKTQQQPRPPLPPPPIFRGLTMYLNGSTAPLVSDHKIKQLFVQHGGNSAFALGRKSVTHVIIGSTCGGGLAARKINKEVTTVGAKGIKYVTAQWVLSSIEKGIRQPEARYVPENLHSRIAGSGQRSVRAAFKPTTTK